MDDRIMPLLSRRHFLTGLASLGLAGCTTTGLGPGSPFPAAFSSFAVDVSILRAKGLGPFADIVAAAALDQLRASFADRTDRNGPRLVVQLTGLTLTPFPDGGGDGPWWRGGGGGGTDSLEGVALAVGRGGEILARHPQLAVLDVRTSILTPNEPGRAAAVARHYVRWLRREL